jgi:hypothetical protein
MSPAHPLRGEALELLNGFTEVLIFLRPVLWLEL